MSDSNVQQAVPFFGVRNIQESVRFYTEGLGFKMADKWIDDGVLRWCRLEHGCASIMLQQFWEAGPHSNIPDTKVGVGVTVCFFCEDAIALWRQFSRRGVVAQRPFVGNGMWVTELRDPDGYELCFESATDAPEESILEDDDARAE